MMSYPADLVQAVADFIEKSRIGEMAPGTAWMDIRDKLLEAKIARIDVVHPREVMVSRANRGGLGVNPYNVHRQLACNKFNGVDIEELEKAVIIELSPVPTERAKHVTFNQRLIARSKEMLAPLNGSELYASVGTGHGIQGYRSTAACCKTPEPSLQDKDKRLNPSTMCHDHRFKTAYEDGWKMLKLPCACRRSSACPQTECCSHAQ